MVRRVKMKNLINVLVSVLIFTGIAIGQIWEQTYDEIIEAGGGSIRTICETKTGYVYASITGSNNFSVFKSEKETGEIIWQKKHYLLSYSDVEKIMTITDDKILIIGGTGSDCKNLLMIADSLGNELKRKIWRPDGFTQSGIRDVVQNEDSTYTALSWLGLSESSCYFSLIKFNENLEIIWAKLYQVEENNVYICDIAKDGENYIGIGSLRGSINNLKPGLMKFDKFGNIVWQKKYPEYSFPGGLAEVTKISNGYLACSLSRHNGNEGPDYAALMKIDNDGNVIWFNDCILSFLDFGWMIKAWKINNEYVGVVKAHPFPYSETFIVKLDTSGNLIGYQKWNRMNVFDAIFTQDQHLLVGGGNSYCDPWAFKTCLPATDIVPLVKEFKLDQNYPNPFNPTTTLQYGLPEQSDAQLNIYDINGRKIKQWNISNQQPGWHEVIWDGTDMHGNMVTHNIKGLLNGSRNYNVFSSKINR